MLKHVVLLCFLFLSPSSCQKNQVTLYDKPNQQGNHLTISMSSNLAWNNFDKKAASVCVSGIMLFYSDIDFQGSVEYVFGGNNYCTNLKLAAKVSSVRYPGLIEDVKKDAITLYSVSFSGTDTRIYGDSFTSTGPATDIYSSLIINGGSNWTVFDDRDFQGNRACLIAPDPANKTPCFLSRPQEIPNFGYWIVSGKKGCDDANNNKVYLIPFAKQGPA